MMNSELHDEKTFYSAILSDLEACKEEVVIESPYITSERMRSFKGVFLTLLDRGVKIYIFTRDPREHYENMEIQSEEAIRWCEAVGIQVLLCLGNYHRKLAILDRKILWEGSLNILSQTYSREIMRRIQGEDYALEMINFLSLAKFL
jgi:phosphatidylserine/phosphatidylglycerophosphate/cardiolipin synthase-like enzyme